MANEYVAIPKEKFEFANKDMKLHDEKLKTKARGYFADAFLRFRKNKSSVVAAWIILFLMTIILPIYHFKLKYLKELLKLMKIVLINIKQNSTN